MDQDGTDLELESTNASEIEIHRLREELEQAKLAVIAAVEASAEANERQLEDIRTLEEREIRAHQEVERQKREIEKLKSALRKRCVKIDNQEDGRREDEDNDGISSPRDSQIEELRKHLEQAMWEVEHKKNKQSEKILLRNISVTGETLASTDADVSTEEMPLKKKRWSKIVKKISRAWCM